MNVEKKYGDRKQGNENGKKRNYTRNENRKS